MKIEYLGHSCFRLTSQTGRTLVTDPYQGVGYELPQQLRADIVTVSHGHFDHNNLAGVKDPLVIANEAKTYTFDGIRVRGIESYHDPKQGGLRGKNIVYKITIDGIAVCHLGDLGEAFNPALVQAIGNCDVLLLPIGGTYTIDAAEAKRYADAIQPKTIIPMHYRPKDGTLDITDEKGFLALYSSEEITCIENGCVELEQAVNTSTKIIFMERTKAE